MPANCSACKNRSNNGSRTTFHKFPAKDKECLKKWVSFVSKARGKGLWKPTVNSKLCSLHFERDCFRYFNGRVYLNSGAAPTVFDIPGHLLKGTRNALPAIVAEAVSDEEREERGSEVVKEKAFDYEGNPLEAGNVKVAKLELSRLDGEQLRRSVVPSANSTPGQRMSAESKESDGKRPIIVHVTSLSNNEPSTRPTRLKRLPEKLRDYDRDFGEEPAKKVPRGSPKHEPEPGVSDDEYLGSESEDLDMPDLDEEDEFEVSGADSPNTTSSPAAASHPTTSLTALRGAKVVPEGGKAGSPVAKPASSTTAGTVVELYTKLAQQCAKNEELTKQLAKAREVIAKQNQNVEALEEVIDGLRRRIVAMTAKLSSDATTTDVSGDGKG